MTNAHHPGAPTTSPGQPTTDVVIIGGGVAGLAAALMLGRSRRSVVVIDAGEPRNAPAAHVHGYLGREGTPPAELLAIGREEVGRYDVAIRDGRAVAARRTPDGLLAVELSDGEVVTGRRLLVATGLTDELPSIPGLAERWGRDVLHCPYCHGWEVRDQPIVVIASGPMGVHQALLFRQLTVTVTMVVHGGPVPTDVQREQLRSRGIRIVESPVTGLVIADDHITGVAIADGTVVAATAVVVGPRFVAQSDVLAALGIEVVDAPLGVGTVVPADESGATSMPGVYVAGNVHDVRAALLQSAAAGAMTGAAINADLVAEDTARAVEAARLWAQHEVPVMDQAFWESRYGAEPAVWSGNPNPHLVTDTADLTPGAALDVGAGEGADAIFLAARGWSVTAVDISTIALERGRRQAELEGVGDRITWQHADVTAWDPPHGVFDLVTMQFMHLPGDERRVASARLAAAVAPDGTLLVVGHHPSDMHAGVGRPHWHEMYFTAEELADELGAGWDVVTAESRPRQFVDQDGNPATIHDAVLVARRR